MPAPDGAETIEQRFDRLADVWLEETAVISSSSQIVAHPAFQEIVGLGPAVIPLLLRELDKRTGHWHLALRRITGDDPVPPAERGDIGKMADAWLRWGKEQGYRRMSRFSLPDKTKDDDLLKRSPKRLNP